MASKNFTKGLSKADRTIDVLTAQEPEELKNIKNTNATAGRKTEYPIIIKKDEIKSRRVQILLRPSIYDEVKRNAEKHNISVNEIINQILQDFIESH